MSKTFVVGVLAIFAATFGTAAPAFASTTGVAGLRGTVSPEVLTTWATTGMGTVGYSSSSTGVAVGLDGTDPAQCDITISVTGTTTIVSGSAGGSLTCNGSKVLGGAIAVTCTSVSVTQTGGVLAVTGTCSGTSGTNLSAMCGIEVVPNATNNTDVLVSECEFSIT